MLSDPAHQPSGAPTAGGSMTTTPPRVRIAPACSAAGTASPRFSSHGQPDARVVDDNALTQPHPTRPDQQPTPGCQCTGGATIDCPPSTARQPGCAGDGGPTPAATTSSTETAVAPMKPTPTPYADPDALPELVALALQGNQRAWQDLVQRYSPLVSSVIRRYRMNDSDADDVRQNLWMRLVEHLKDIREPRALPGWVMTTTRNEAIRVLRRQTPHRTGRPATGRPAGQHRTPRTRRRPDPRRTPRRRPRRAAGTTPRTPRTHRTDLRRHPDLLPTDQHPTRHPDRQHRQRPPAPAA